MKSKTPFNTPMKIVFVFIFFFIAVYCIQNQFFRSKKIIIEHWTELTESDRIEKLEIFAQDFMVENPNIKVVIIPVPEDEFHNKINQAIETGTLPDTIRIGFENIGGLMIQGVLDTKTATEIVNDLDKDTWGEGTLSLFSSLNKDEYAAVPTDGWLQGIWYRKDLFEQKGLVPPTSWEAILDASVSLHNPDNDFYGIIIGTDPQATYTQQNYEHFALSNNAKAFNYYTREPILNSSENIETMNFYTELSQYTLDEPVSWQQANEYYLTGKVSMIMYSTYILDDILGLDKREWTPIHSLPNKTGFVTTIESYSGHKAAWGNIYGLGVTTTANKEEAKLWIKYLADERLYDYCSISPVGMMPTRKTISNQWQNHEFFRTHFPDLPNEILSGFSKIERWGYQEGKVFPQNMMLYSELLVPKAIDSVLVGNSTIEEALDWVQSELLEEDIT